MKGRVVHSLNIKSNTVVHTKGEETQFLNSNMKKKYNKNVNTPISNIPIKSMR